MASLNKVFLIGNLTRDPELRYTAGGTAVASLRIAVTQRFVNRNTKEQRSEVVFVDVTVWGRQAEACGEYLSKGSSLFVEGRLNLDTWESREGQRRSRLSIVAQRVQFIGRPRGTETKTMAEAGVEDTSQDVSVEVPVEDAVGLDTGEIPPDGNSEGIPF